MRLQLHRAVILWFELTFNNLSVIRMVQLGRVKRIWYLSPMRAAKFQASLGIRTVSPEPLLLAHTSSESRGTFKQKARSLAPLNGWACAVKICHDGMLKDTNSLDASKLSLSSMLILCCLYLHFIRYNWAKYGSSIGCTAIMHVCLVCGQLQDRSLHPATFFHGVWSWNNFYNHSLPSAHSRRAVVSYWWKNVH